MVGRRFAVSRLVNAAARCALPAAHTCRKLSNRVFRGVTCTCGTVVIRGPTFGRSRGVLA